MKLQRGLSINALMIGGAAIGVLALLAMKIVPEYMEFGTVVKTVKATAADTSLKDASVAQVRTSFAKRAEIDSIKSISEKDLDITKEGGELVISFAYTKKVPLFKNVSLVFSTTISLCETPPITTSSMLSQGSPAAPRSPKSTITAQSI